MQQQSARGFDSLVMGKTPHVLKFVGDQMKEYFDRIAFDRDPLTGRTQTTDDVSAYRENANYG